MKKQFTIFLLTLGILSSAFAGCGKEKSDLQPSSETESSVEVQTETQTDSQESEASLEETMTISGILEEKKDMLFIITTDEEISYSIGFEEAPEGYDELKAGDTVVLEYTGELSEVDAFTGKIISLKAQ